MLTRRRLAAITLLLVVFTAERFVVQSPTQPTIERVERTPHRAAAAVGCAEDDDEVLIAALVYNATLSPVAPLLLSPVRHQTALRFRVRAIGTLPSLRPGDEQHAVFCFVATLSRVHTLPLIVERWNGPLSVVVWIANDATALSSAAEHRATQLRRWLGALCDGFARLHRRTGSTLLPSLVMTAVFERSWPPLQHEPFRPTSASLPHSFPINQLRNLAIRHSALLNSEIVFVTDADMIPSIDASASLAAHVRAVEANTTNAVVVVPSFETLGASSDDRSDIAELFFPRTKHELRRTFAVAATTTNVSAHRFFVPFRMASSLSLANARALDQLDVEYDAPLVGPRFFGYGPTRHGHWLRSNSSYEVEAVARYEPYVAARRSSLPRFSPLLYDRGMNFAYWTLVLRLMHKRFVVQPDVFVVHHVHASRIEQAKIGKYFRNYVARLLKAVHTHATPWNCSNEPSLYFLLGQFIEQACEQVLHSPQLAAHVDAEPACDSPLVQTMARCSVSPADRAASRPSEFDAIAAHLRATMFQKKRIVVGARRE